MKKTDKDPWKQMVDSQKSEFDSRQPRDAWNDIESALAKQESGKTISLWSAYKYAAVFVARKEMQKARFFRSEKRDNLSAIFDRNNSR